MSDLKIGSVYESVHRYTKDEYLFEFFTSDLETGRGFLLDKSETFMFLTEMPYTRKYDKAKGHNHLVFLRLSTGQKVWYIHGAQNFLSIYREIYSV